MDLLKEAQGIAPAKRLLELLHALPVPHEQVEELALAIAAYAGHRPPAEPKTNGTVQRPTLEQPCSTIEGLQMLAPRGRFDLLFYEGHAQLKSPKQSFDLPYDSIHTIAIFDKIPNDARKRVLIFLGLEDAAGGKQPLKSKSAIIQVQSDGKLDIPSPTDPLHRLEGLSAVVLCQAFGEMVGDSAAFVAPSKDCFSSSEGHPALEAIVGVNSGWLFPLPSALCFLERPPLWIKHSDIASLETGRTSDKTRSFVLYVHHKDGKITEFNNIPRSNLDALLQYIADSDLAFDSDPAGEAGPAKPTGGKEKAEDSEDSEESDSDFDPEESDEDDVEAAQRENGSDKSEEDSSKDIDEASSGGSGSDSDVSVVSDDDVPSSRIKELVSNDKHSSKRKRL